MRKFVYMLFLTLVIVLLPNVVNADEVNGEKAVEEMSQEELHQLYDQELQEAGLTEEDTDFSFEEWEAFISIPEPEEKPLLKSSIGSYSMVKGDILIVPGESSMGGLVGHAGIAISGEHILMAPGNTPKNGAIKLINLQDWRSKYGKNKTNVYRVSNRDVAYDAGHWAYTHFWNSNGGGTRNINTTYNFWTAKTKVRNPTYCSQIVWQSYYFGTGSRPVIKVTPTRVSPYDLPTYFNNSYKPKYIGKF